MNIKLTTLKTAISIIVSLLISFYFSFRFFCLGTCRNAIFLLGKTYSFSEWKSWIIFLITFIISAFIIYLIWSLFQKKK